MLGESDLRFFQGLIDTGMIDGLREETPPAPPAGVERFGRYELLETIGKGAMGSVYRARDPQLDRVVALKVFHATPSPPLLKRFQREARIMARLRGPNLVAVHELVQQESSWGIAMEYVEGTTLAQELERGALPTADLVRLVAESARGLEEAHRQGVVHRDVKPANILVDRDGKARIADFGVASVAGSEEGLTASGDLLGTPSYMSPEQIRDGAEGTDARTDVWSLGVVLYRAITGRHPFTATTSAEIMNQILHEEPDPPASVNPRAPRDLATICSKAIEHDRDRRYASAADMADDLVRFLRGEPIAAAPPSLPRRLRRWARRHSRVAAALGALALASLLLGGYGWIRHGESLRRARAEEDHRRVLERVELAEQAGREISTWDLSLAARPEDISVPAQLERMRSIDARLRQLLEEDPALAVAHFHRARVARRLARPEDAARELDEALRLRPGDPAFLLERGLFRLEVWSRTWVWARLASRLFSLAEFGEEAPADFRAPTEALADLEAAEPDGLSPLSESYARLLAELAGNAAAASNSVDEFERRWDGDPDFGGLKAELHYFVAVLLVARTGDARSALRELDLALDIRRSCHEAFALRAIVRSALFYGGGDRPGDAELARAQKDAELALALMPDASDGYLATGIVRGTSDFLRLQSLPRERWPEILDRMRATIAQFYDRAVSLDPSNPAGYLYRARALLFVGHLLAQTHGSGLRAVASRSAADLEEAGRLLGGTGWLIEFMKCRAYDGSGDGARASAAWETSQRLARAAGVDERWMGRIRKAEPRR